MTGTPFPSMSPPTAPDPNVHAQRSLNWPTVVGVITIVFGAGGVFFGVIGIITWSLLRGSAFFGPQAGAMEKYAPAMIALQVVYVLLAALLLTGGILLVMKRRKAVVPLLIWSYCKIVYGAVYGVVNGLIQQESMQTVWTQSAAGPGAAPPPAVQAGFTTGVMIGSVAFMLIWSAILPVFLIIWFARRRVKTDVADEFLPRAEPTYP